MGYLLPPLVTSSPLVDDMDSDDTLLCTLLMNLYGDDDDESFKLGCDRTRLFDAGWNADAPRISDGGDDKAKNNAVAAVIITLVLGRLEIIVLFIPAVVLLCLGSFIREISNRRASMTIVS